MAEITTLLAMFEDVEPAAEGVDKLQQLGVRIMGAVPIALGLGAGSLRRRPLGYAIVGGVFFSTALTLFLVPVAYVLFERLRVWLGGRQHSGASEVALARGR